jgi:ribosomal protein S18 acetylase RimI-like enzyme
MIQTIEELSLNSWPALQTIFDDGWILRFANGYTRRANSILPLYPSRQKRIEKIERSERLYQDRGQPAIFKLPGRREAKDLDLYLAERGYQTEADTSVQLATLDGQDGEVPEDVRLAGLPDAHWEAGFQAMSGLSQDRQAIHRQILAAIVPRCCFAAVLLDGAIVGCGLGVAQAGYLGIYDVLIDAGHRRQGYGEKLMRGLLVWGKQQGAHSAYLNVMIDNTAALALYARLGFREIYQYWYRVGPRVSRKE